LLEVLVVFTVSISSFNKSDCLDFIANDEWAPIHPTSIHCLSGLGQCWSLDRSCDRS